MAVRQNKVVGRSQQTVWDIALQQYGSADGILYLLMDNPDLINSNSLVVDGRREYRLRNDVYNEVIRTAMLGVVPSTGANNQNEEWITENDNWQWQTEEPGNQPWVTDVGG
jgi:hypothetical protein